jgi:hypothetical protein
VNNLAATAAVDFGAQTRQMLNLFGFLASFGESI